MAKKQKKKRMKKYKQKYFTGGRVDYSKGGRVGYQVGGNLDKKPEPQDKDDMMSIGGPGGENVQGAADEPVDIGDIGNDEGTTGGGVTDDTDWSFGNNTPTGPTEKEERLAETAKKTQEASEGKVPEAAIIPDAEQTGFQRDSQGNLILDEDGNAIPLKEQEVTPMEEITKPVEGTPAEQIADEPVVTKEVTKAELPEEEVKAEKITEDELSIVPEEVDVKVEEGKINEEKLAEAAEVADTPAIEGAKVEIPEGALAEAVTGELSEDAIAIAAKNAGTSLARITRAKKQLRNAGLSEADIEEIGNDPDALEARLTDFTEEERGIIEGLPEEALVSTQIDGLLAGIENGEIPVWAKPAVAQVEQMLARRGMSASTVGRDALLNTIIQAAMPIAQSNAQAIQASVSQQKSIEAQAAEADAQRQQQVALDKANKVFQMDLTNLNNAQQVELSNSKFLQTVALTETSNEQQAAVQNALIVSQQNLAEANFNQQAQIENAKAFLAMDMANLNNQQQANVLKAQQEQQRVLSNQAAQNAAAQFNAASENQTNQFMASLAANMSQYNASQANAMAQFNATQENAAAARNANRAADIEKFNAQLLTQVEQFNSQQEFARNQWNAQNSAAVEASNVQWRRQANTANTAAQNQINMQNAMNAFGFSSQAMSFLWQELRDQADFDFRAFENEENRKVQIIATAIANEGKPGEKYDDYLTGLLSTLNSSYQIGLG